MTLSFGIYAGREQYQMKMELFYVILCQKKIFPPLKVAAVFPLHICTFRFVDCGENTICSYCKVKSYFVYNKIFSHVTSLNPFAIGISQVTISQTSHCWDPLFPVLKLNVHKTSFLHAKMFTWVSKDRNFFPCISAWVTLLTVPSQRSEVTLHLCRGSKLNYQITSHTKTWQN